MGPGSAKLVQVFPITTTAFGLRSDWFTEYVPKLIHPAYLLMTLLLVVSIGLMALKRFESADLEKKAWNIPVLLTVVIFWPTLVLGMKDLIDTFNTFLVLDIFKIPWSGFGFPALGSYGSIIGFPAEGLARLLPNLAYWVIYAFFLVFFFFLAVLGPLVLAKGILSDEMDTFFELVKELANLFLWQTTLVVLVAFVMPDIVSGKPFPPQPQANFYFLSLILGILIFFVPTLTRKFALQIESAFIPLGFRYGGTMLGFAAAAKITGSALAMVGTPVKMGERVEQWKEQLSKAEDFRSRYDQRRQIQELSVKKGDMEDKLDKDEEVEQQAKKEVADPFIDLSKKAKEDMEEKE